MHTKAKQTCKVCGADKQKSYQELICSEYEAVKLCTRCKIEICIDVYPIFEPELCRGVIDNMHIISYLQMGLIGSAVSYL